MKTGREKWSMETPQKKKEMVFVNNSIYLFFLKKGAEK